MILAPGPFQAIYIAAAGSVALAVIPGDKDRQKSDVVLSADPWAVAYRRDRAVEFVFWYADARAADRARGLFLPQYLGGADPADIARMIFRGYPSPKPCGAFAKMNRNDSGRSIDACAVTLRPSSVRPWKKTVTGATARQRNWRLTFGDI